MHVVNSIGVNEYSQSVGGRVSPACCTLNVRCPTVILPVRATGSRFPARAYDTVPEPLPELPAVTESQGASVVAVHAQCEATETENVPEAGPSPNEALLGEISSVHVARPS
jgi:hypothetical protein